jgi:uncharacterized protein YbjT (DUF2867 family)
MMGDMEAKVAMLAGASGFVGGYVLDVLLDAGDFGRVYAITRRPLGRTHPRIANRIVQFDRLEEQLKGLQCHVALCCLGTTIRQAGSQEAFRRVDIDYVLAFARAAKAAGASRFVMVSSVGADSRSRNFYLRVKGEAEEALEGMGFASLDILQPGLLLGMRRAMRPLDLAMSVAMPVLNPLLMGSYEQYRGIPARTVAAAMLGAARSGRRGIYRYTYAGMRMLAHSRGSLRAAAVGERGVRSGAGRSK